MVESFLCILIFALAVYTVIPTFLMRVFSISTYPKWKTGRGIALTFDDGPDPRYTPILLDLLKKHSIKATFFVMGSKAEQCKEIILRIHQEGHLIGLHNYVHRANGLMMPWKVRRQLNDSVEIIERIIGEKPNFYRPPWGIVNIFDFFLSRRFRIVLWSLSVGDWMKRTGKQKIKKRLFAKLKNGCIILLHDSGETMGADLEAPAHMLEALDEFLTETSQLVYPFVRIDERIPALENKFRMDKGLGNKMLFAFWMKWERLFHSLFHVYPVDPQNTLLHIKLCRYKGKIICLDDGEVIQTGDRIIELHLDNETLFTLGVQSSSAMQLAVQLIRSLDKCLPQISERIINHPDYQDVKGLYGISILHRGAKQFGFTVTELPKGILFFVTKAYLRCLLYVVHPQGKQRLRMKTNLLTPKIIAISARKLRRRYPTA